MLAFMLQQQPKKKNKCWLLCGYDFVVITISFNLEWSTKANEGCSAFKYSCLNLNSWDVENDDFILALYITLYSSVLIFFKGKLEFYYSSKDIMRLLCTIFYFI